ncbi:MAG: rRNA maturation RNase YbeY [Candidatus Pacebacteria bacterium]|nr:rRNA maturation RNase YbeY [Candidatus Paceibacterota bacterium]
MIEINNLSSKKINKSLIKRTIKTVLREEGKKIKNISVAILNPEEIKAINLKYRKKNKATDILSFGEGIMEIIICPEEVLKNGDDFEKELKEVVIHGVLHLLGYDHEKDEVLARKMLNKQKRYLKIN